MWPTSSAPSTARWSASTGCAPRRCSYNESAEILQHVWIAARSSLREVFETVTIEALAARTLPAEVEALTHDEDAWQPH